MVKNYFALISKSAEKCTLLQFCTQRRLSIAGFIEETTLSSEKWQSWALKVDGLRTAEKSQEKVIEFYDLKRGYNHFS